VQLTAPSAFLTWADGHGLTLATCSQADLDAWHATHAEHHRRTVRGFLSWAMTSYLMPRLDIPLQQVLKGDPVSQRQRLDLIRRAVTDDRMRIRTHRLRDFTSTPARPEAVSGRPVNPAASVGTLPTRAASTRPPAGPVPVMGLSMGLP
jgi:hypothetical protein